MVLLTTLGIRRIRLADPSRCPDSQRYCKSAANPETAGNPIFVAFSGSRKTKCAENRSAGDKNLPTGQIFFRFGVQSLMRSAPCTSKVSFLSSSAQTDDQRPPPAARTSLRTVQSGTKGSPDSQGSKGARATQTATVKVSSLRVTARYIVSRSNGSRPASVISRTRSARLIPCGVVAPASW
jgi:hypothetical protein